MFCGVYRDNDKSDNNYLLLLFQLTVWAATTQPNKQHLKNIPYMLLQDTSNIKKCDLYH